ncbi:MAG: hypothetical protein Q9220_006769 [cf. Caloplaca sp. 1 TL-2023]
MKTPFFEVSGATLAYKLEGRDPRDPSGWRTLDHTGVGLTSGNVGPIKLGSVLAVTQQSTTASCTVRWNTSDLRDATVFRTATRNPIIIEASVDPEVSIPHSISYDLDERAARQLPLAKYCELMQHLRFRIRPSRLKAAPGSEKIDTVDAINDIKALLSGGHPQGNEAPFAAYQRQSPLKTPRKRAREEEMDDADIERLEAVWREKVIATGMAQQAEKEAEAVLEEKVIAVEKAQQEEKGAKESLFSAVKLSEPGEEARKKRVSQSRSYSRSHFEEVVF